MKNKILLHYLWIMLVTKCNRVNEKHIFAKYITGFSSTFLTEILN